ncbi:MAG: hypothetical protein ACR2QC_11310, partial [Gammaproteobacteria bacterium]
SGESRNLFNSIPAKAGISSPKAVIVAEGVYNYPPLCGGGDSCFRRNGTGGEAGIAEMADFGGQRGIQRRAAAKSAAEREKSRFRRKFGQKSRIGRNFLHFFASGAKKNGTFREISCYTFGQERSSGVGECGRFIREREVRNEKDQFVVLGGVRGVCTRAARRFNSY